MNLNMDGKEISEVALPSRNGLQIRMAGPGHVFRLSAVWQGDRAEYWIVCYRCEPNDEVVEVERINPRHVVGWKWAHGGLTAGGMYAR